MNQVNPRILRKLSYAWLCALYLCAYLPAEEKPTEELKKNSAVVQALFEKEQYRQALPIAERSLQLAQTIYGPNASATAQYTNDLAVLVGRTGDYPRAEMLFKKALAIRRKTLGSGHADTLQSLKDFASFYKYSGDFKDAEPLLKEVLSTTERKSGPNSVETARALNSLAELYREVGDYDQAEPLHKRALKIRMEKLPSDDAEIAGSLNNLSLIYRARKDYVHAVAFAEQAVEMDRKAGRSKVSATFIDLNNLAELWREGGKYEAAESLYLEAIAGAKEVLGPDDPTTLALLGNLAELYAQKGDFKQAAPLMRKVYEGRLRAMGPNNPDTIVSLNEVASIHQADKEYAQAETEFAQALAFFEKSYGPNHPRTIAVLSNLAAVHWVDGHPEKAVSEFSQELEGEQKNATALLRVGSEQQKRSYVQGLKGSTDSMVTFALDAKTPQPAASRLAFSAVLQRKGLALEAVTNEIGSTHAARLSSVDRQMLASLKQKTAALAAMTISGPGESSSDEFQSKFLGLEAEAEQLKGEISNSNAQFRAQSQPVTIEKLQAALPQAAALVEFTRYSKFQPDQLPDAWGEDRYAAFIVGPSGGPLLVDVGKAQEIDALCQQFRFSLGTPANAKQTREIARELDHLVMERLRPSLAGIKQILLSPDGELNLVPFSALVDENGEFLATRFQISFLTAGRDVLRLQVASASRQEPWIFANPLYGSGMQSSASACHFDPLTATAAEAADMKGLFTQARLFTGEQATKSSLQAASGPRILHLATHGFYDSGRCLAQNLDPMLHSGLALAGANNGNAGMKSGIITALELADLDLWGTQLVVLSACDTGVGETPRGEGVFGLRRALTLAGSRAQLISLWKVDDEHTRLFMKGFYEHVLKGEGRSQALWDVQQDMLAQGLDPYYWAAFIISGDWNPLT
jgi:CHAT domain-containing protein